MISDKEINELSGTALDAAIAKALGYTHVEVSMYARPHDVLDMPRPCYWETEYGLNYVMSANWQPQPFRPSTDERLVWVFIDVLLAKHGAKVRNGFTLVYDDRGTHPEDFWYCEFPDPWIDAAGSTRAEALSRLCLKVITATKGE